MKKITIKPILFLLLLAVSCSLAANSAQAVSIGVSPASIQFDNVLKGGYAEGTVSVSTSSATPLNLTMRAEGAVKDWITFEPSENITFSSGDMKRISIMVRPPSDAANGLYTGSVIATTSAAKTGGSGVGAEVTTGAVCDVAVRVTGDEIKKASVILIDAKDTEEELPAEFSVSISNDGNVMIAPLIKIEIMKKGTSEVLKTITHSTTTVLPTKTSIIRIMADTKGLPIGEYTGKVTVFLDSEKLAEKELSFNIFERGTLRKSGVLQKIWNEPWANVGDVVKIDAYFENQGEMMIIGKLKGEIYNANRLVNVTESDELEVPVGKVVVMSAYFKPEFPGQYLVRGQVVYGGKTTETKESYINVNPGGEALPRGLDYTTLAVAAAALLIIALLLFRFRSKRTRR